MKEKLIRSIKHPCYIGNKLLYIFSHLISDECYVKARYLFSTGKKLNLDNPQTFNDKLNWLKLYDHNPLYTTMADKYAVKEFVAKVIGEQYIIPTIGCWDRPEDIDWNSLPNQFVLKCNHNSTVQICNDKSKLDISSIKKVLAKQLRTNYYYKDREWPYKNIKRKIIAEKYMSDGIHDLIDYKFFCFSGEPKYCQVIQDRSTVETIDIFDMEWNHQNFVGLNPAAIPAAICPEKPRNFEEMKEIAAKLSCEMTFSRIDLYEVEGRVYFGEITFFPASGRGNFTPEKWNYTFGSWIKLPLKS